MVQDAKNTLRVGEVLNDKWVILEFIAKGGMGEVYRAHQLNLKRDVAIKIISKEWLDGLADNEEGLQSGLQRFRNEVEAMAQVRHPNVLHIFDYGSITVGSEDAPSTHEYIAMEFIPGSTLRSTMSEEGFLPEEDLIRDWLMEYFLPVLDGVQAIHAAGIIHRDLKPENIMLDGNIPKIADFGLARSKRVGRISVSADMFGTPAYMSPEQFLDFRRTDRRSDIYSLGKILYESLAGRMTEKTLPFKVVGLENPDTPFLRRLDAIIRESTSEMKVNRPENVADFRKSLLEAMDISSEEGMENVSATASPGSSIFSGGRFRKRWIWISATGILLVGLLFSMEYKRRHSPGNIAMQSNRSTVSETGGITAPLDTPRTFHRTDNGVMHLIPAGTFILPEGWGHDSGKNKTIASFYLDETPVTNYQYVDFLNREISRITVQEGSVRVAGKIWLMLGEVLEGYEPIIFEEGEFHIKNPIHSSCPVVRVTAYGAAAYARFYGERLPTAAEWLYALVSGRKAKSPSQPGTQDVTGGSGTKEAPAHMMSMEEWQMTDEEQSEPIPGGPALFPYPVMLYTADKYGVRGLNQNIGEWTVQKVSRAKNAKPGDHYAIMGALREGRNKRSLFPVPLPRQPWEAFKEVGFRCVRSSASPPQ